ncbi:MAG: ribosomal protein L30P [Cenarchaeum symbiont of Oopsacas minuta]|nr:ribosomal protein L30P [Cenarchaeum symbiont of Oopsacas minuta]
MNMAKSYLVVRIKGQVDVPYWARTTLELLRLDKKYRATILQTQVNTLGMLDKVKHYICWQEADVDITKQLLDKKGRKSGYRKIESADIVDMGFKDIDEMASSIAKGKVSMSKIKALKPWFALDPPRHGFKSSTKRLYTQKGILGHNKELTDIVRNMM